MTFYLIYYIIYTRRWVINMKKSYLDRQMINVKENYNYFMSKLITSVLKILCKLSIILLIGSILNNTIFIIFEILFTIYSLYNTIYILNYYFDIMKDIKETAKLEDNYFEIDLNLVQSNLFSGIIK